MEAQTLEKYQWKNRVLLILNSDSEKYNLEKQILKLSENKKGLKERKLVIYQIMPEAYKTIIPKNSEWTENMNLYKRFSLLDQPFKVVLIGLDGSIKLEQNSFLSIDTLFRTIDAMPMRRSELKNE